MPPPHLWVALEQVVRGVPGAARAWGSVVLKLLEQAPIGARRSNSVSSPCRAATPATRARVGKISTASQFSVISWSLFDLSERDADAAALASKEARG